MAITKIKPIKGTLKKALDYIMNPDKTDGKMLVSSYGCSYETADIEFGFKHTLRWQHRGAQVPQIVEADLLQIVLFRKNDGGLSFLSGIKPH